MNTALSSYQGQASLHVLCAPAWKNFPDRPSGDLESAAKYMIFKKIFYFFT